MNHIRLPLIVFLLAFILPHAMATICSDPNQSSLQKGEVPPPWQVNPFSENKPQGEINTRFIRANILVAGFGRGVICVYQNSIGYYSIWWPVKVKVPARTDNNWIESLGGFECSSSLEECVFYPASQ